MIGFLQPTYMIHNAACREGGDNDDGGNHHNLKPHTANTMMIIKPTITIHQTTATHITRTIQAHSGTLLFIVLLSTDDPRRDVPSIAWPPDC